VFIEARIVDHSETKNKYYEGCGSVKYRVIGDVYRYDQVELEGWEINLSHFNKTSTKDTPGNIRVRKFREWTPANNHYVGRIAQHELDHQAGQRFPAIAVPGTLREITEPEKFTYRNPRAGTTPLSPKEAQLLVEQATPFF